MSELGLMSAVVDEVVEMVGGGSVGCFLTCSGDREEGEEQE